MQRFQTPHQQMPSQQQRQENVVEMTPLAPKSFFETQIQELEDELKVVGQNMKTLELSETDALARQEKFEETIRTLTHSLKMTEIQAAQSEREAARLQKELDAVIIELQDWKDKYEEVCVELEQTFNEMAGY